ncbi:MAG: TrkA C-terminal domain-containing protein [Arcobacteraceae bacterium]|nr:TrkA C-terminal domain-containing protein [Arcobacteraceae bacterium]
MKRVLILLDGIVAKNLLKRLVELDTSHSVYDVVYMNDSILTGKKPVNFTFYKFDPTSLSKLKMIMSKVSYNDVLVVLGNKDDTVSVIENIRTINPTINFNVYNEWDIDLADKNIQNYNAIDILTSGLIERLPNVPIIAQNIGLKQGEIMEIKIPFGSSYAYRYISSISQKEWKIFALYRNNLMVNVRPSLILKPNDIILVIGKPKVLLQAYAAISMSSGHFPMPFGKNIYVYLDMYLQIEDDALNAVKKARYLHERLNNTKLIIRVTRPALVGTIDKIKDLVKHIDNKILEFDYHNLGVLNLMTSDIKKYEVGMFVLTNTLLKDPKIIQKVLVSKKPIFKVGIENINNIKTITMVLNSLKVYEQLSPILFDISSQLKYKVNVINSDPIGDTDRTKLTHHLDSLAKIFNQEIKIETNGKNPMDVLKTKENILQILPLKEDMFKKRVISFFTTNSDLLSYDLKYLNQIIIPIVE